MADHSVQIQQQYLAYVGHPVDPRSLTYWNGVLDGGASVQVIAQALVATPDYLFAEGSRSNTQLVSDLYMNLFGRIPETAGINYWSGQLTSGAVSITNLGAALASSATGNDLGALNAKVAVAAAITAAVDTPAEIAAFNGTTVDRLTHDYLLPVKDAPSQLLASVPGSIDALVAQAVAGTPVQSPTLPAAHAVEMEQLYLGFFGRAADPAGMVYWETLLANGTVTHNQVAATFAASKEYHDATALGSNRAAIDSLYVRLFGHSADTAGLNYWDNAMSKGSLGINDLVAALTSSAVGTDKLVYNARVDVATAVSAHINTTIEIAAYNSPAANLLVSNYIANVHDYQSMKDALVPATIDLLITQISGQPAGVAPETVALVGQAPVVAHALA